MKSITLDLQLNPEPWTAPSVSVGRGKGGKVFPQVYANAQLKAYQEAVREEARSQLPDKWEPYEGEILLHFYFWRQMADYESHQAKRVRKHQADVTNMQKATEDALQG